MDTPGEEVYMKRILVADDEVHIVRILRFNLERANYQVITASNGEEAYQVAVRERPDLIFLAPEADFRSDDFAQWLNRADIAFLSRLPRFVSANDAIREDTGKQTALERMEALNVETLPVTDEKGKFAGVVDRSRLTASLIIDVSSKLK